MFRIEHGKGIGRIMLVVALAVISLACVTSAMLVPVPTAQGTLYAAHLEKAGTPAAGRARRVRSWEVFARNGVQMNISPWVEVCPPDRHVYYTAFLSYLFCPYCGERLYSG